MSETVHYKGVATKVDQPIDKTVIEVAEAILKERGKEMAVYYDNAIECLCEEYYDEYFYHHKAKSLYSITKEWVELEDDIIKADINSDGTIQYEVRYYNGGAGFSECLENAFNELDKTK